MYSHDYSISSHSSDLAAPMPVWAGAMLRRLMRGLSCGQLAVDTLGGSIAYDSGKPGPQARLTLHSWRSLWRVLVGGNVGFARSYIEGEW